MADESQRELSFEVSPSTENRSNSAATKRRSPQFSVRVIGDRTAELRQEQMREQREREEAERQELERIAEIMNQEALLRNRCKIISSKARGVRKLSAQTRQAVESMIEEYDEAVSEFDETMSKVYESEVDRIEAERKYVEFLATNAGRDADYFKVPSFLVKKQSMKKRLKDLRMQKEKTWNNSIKLGKSQQPTGLSRNTV